MKEDIFKLRTEQLKDIAISLQKKIELGLDKDKMEHTIKPIMEILSQKMKEGLSIYEIKALFVKQIKKALERVKREEQNIQKREGLSQEVKDLFIEEIKKFSQQGRNEEAEEFIKVIKNFNTEEREIQCLPTYIVPKTDIKEGKALVLDLGGTNYRAALVEFSDGKATIHPENGWKKDLSVMKTEGFTRDQLFEKMSDVIKGMNLEEDVPIGYCFSYPAGSLANGDAKLLRWTKGVNIKEMINEPVGETLVDYLNENSKKVKFTGVKVINDTVASLFAGLTEGGYDAYIGLIVGTGTNMAGFINSDRINKIDPEIIDQLKSDSGIKDGGVRIPVNLESGNFRPPYLNVVDDKVDIASDSRGAQRFEKAVSGMYLGEVLKYVFSCDEIEENFDAQKLTSIMNYPDMYKRKYVNIARLIYIRSAKLVAASLAGLIKTLISHDNTVKKIQLTAEGSLFWSEDRKGKNYKDLVLEELQSILVSFGHNDIHININKMENANLIGSAIAALSK